MDQIVRSSMPAYAYNVPAYAYSFANAGFHLVLCLPPFRTFVENGMADGKLCIGSKVSPNIELEDAWNCLFACLDILLDTMRRRQFIIESDLLSDLL
ncbi:hypothetical protein Tco_1432722 [Tanacetum coccineum]